MAQVVGPEFKPQYCKKKKKKEKKRKKERKYCSQEEIHFLVSLGQKFSVESLELLKVEL
jgi:glutamine amidotransferase-like uncharacterized protein